MLWAMSQDPDSRSCHDAKTNRAARGPLNKSFPESDEFTSSPRLVISGIGFACTVFHSQTELQLLLIHATKGISPCWNCNNLPNSKHCRLPMTRRAASGRPIFPRKRKSNGAAGRFAAAGPRANIAGALALESIGFGWPSFLAAPICQTGITILGTLKSCRDVLRPEAHVLPLR